MHAVTLDEVAWADLPDREEAGTPNLLGAVAFAAASRRLTEIGMQRVAVHERALLARLVDGLRRIDGVTRLRPARSDGDDRRRAVHGRRASTTASWPQSSGTSTGSPCAAVASAPIRTWPGCSGSTSRRRPLDAARARTATSARRRAWCGPASASTTIDEDVDRLVDAVARIAAGDVAGEYGGDDHGEFRPLRGAA